MSNKTQFNVCNVFYSLYSHKHVSAAIAAIFSVTLLQEYKSTYVVGCAAVTPFAFDKEN